MSATPSDFKEHSGKKNHCSAQWIMNVCVVCTRAKLRCRHGVWDLNTFRVSLVPFYIGEGSSFSLIMWPFEPDCFKDVHLMDPEAPNIFDRALCRMKKRKDRGGPWAVQISPRKSESLMCQEKQ